MSHLASRPLRCLRSVVLAGVAAVLSIASHVLAGGELPGLGTAALAAVPLGCAAVVVARRRCGLVSAMAFLGISQWALHKVLSAPTQVCTEAASGTYGHHVDLAASCTPAHMHGGGSTLMLALHALATVAIGLLLVHGERALERLWTWLGVRAIRPLRGALPVARQPEPVTRPVFFPAEYLYREHAPRRGPPLSRAVAAVLA